MSLTSSQQFSLKTEVLDSETQVFVQKGLLKESLWVDLLKSQSLRIVLITDKHVRALWGESILMPLVNEGCHVEVVSIIPGEGSKTREVKEALEDAMLQKKLGRDCLVVALGGGVVTDLAGFVAATYCRGVPLVLIPTTLLGQVDASLGGKVAVNTAYGKNLIGAFYPPRWVFIDSDTLTTLPEEEFLNGMAEVIKHALIVSKDLFHGLKNLESEEMIYQSCLIKKIIVEKDPFEKGLRRILNFGHTVGHALEALTHYHLSHGKAVAIGMLAEAHLSYQSGFLPYEQLLTIETLLIDYGYSLKLPLGIDSKQLFETMTRDKKAQFNLPKCVFLREIGEVVEAEGEYCLPIDVTMLHEMCLWLNSR